MQSLRCFAAGGGRIYGEGSGLAYLCREMVLPCGRAIAMTGLLPATARCVSISSTAEPVEITFGVGSWLAPARTAIRGYRHNGWQIEPRGPMITYGQGPSQRLDVLGRGVRVTAVAPDGVVEAIEFEGRPVLGVQWELQEEWRIDGRFAAVFTWLVAAARERAVVGA